MYVLDSSVLIAVMKSEPGSEEMLRYFDGSVMCAINYSEVLQKFEQLGGSATEVAAIISGFDLQVVPIEKNLAAETASLWNPTKGKGLSLAHRSCLALARALSGIAVTADRAWVGLDVPGVAIHVISRD